MSDYREQAIRDVAAACGLSERVVRRRMDRVLCNDFPTTRYAVAQRERVLELEAQSATAAAKELELGAQWLRHEGFDSAADSLLLIRPGEITGEDREWASRMVAKLEAQLQQKEGERG